jgi:hypothetical protein
MTQADRIKKAVGEFGASAKSKLANPAATGQPEDQLRAPLEALFRELALAAGWTASSARSSSARSRQKSAWSL